MSIAIAWRIAVLLYTLNAVLVEPYMPNSSGVALDIGVLAIESDQELQEALLSVHHSYVATFARTDTIKVIENPLGSNLIVRAQHPRKSDKLGTQLGANT